LGIIATPKKLALAYANAHRLLELYESIFMQLLEKCHSEAVTRSRSLFCLINKLMSLDGNIIELSVTTLDCDKPTQCLIFFCFDKLCPE
jgi:hypothetical protein